MKTIKTSKGSELPLISLKGRDYLMVAYRLQWLSEDVERYVINTNLDKVDDEQTIARATIIIYNKEGHIMRQATATKRETKKDFSDHTEKAETAAIGRALAMVGFGTQHALADLDEGSRLADSPLDSKPSAQAKAATPEQSPVHVAPEVSKARTTFRKPPRTEMAKETPAAAPVVDVPNKDVAPKSLNF